ncbi:MAG: ABC-F family ATP-binding cassette domain-containing protein, partial [Nitrospirae bacterium]|nr:ABC-F family ATP-binding cassette domain-containing protein [Nitrospirota bacterium]
YLTQEVAAGTGTLFEVMLSARPEVLDIKRRLDASSGEVADLAGDGGEAYEAALEEYGRLLDDFEQSGGYAYDNAVTGALIGLGFDRDDFGRGLETLSGGQKTRLALAKILLAGHTVLLLDEPTNHLDIPAIGWLEEFLKAYDGAVLIVSHDRYFLDRAADRIIELENGKVEEYPGNYSFYREEKERRTEARMRDYELASAKYEKEKEYINRMRAGVHARQAKGRERRLSRFEMPDAPSREGEALTLRWDEVKRSSDNVLKVEGISKHFGRTEIVRDASFTLRRVERAGIVGRNGTGKSTLLRIIIGTETADSGKSEFGPNVKPAYYSQGLEGLDEDNTVLDELWSVSPLAVEQKIRDMLGSFRFTGDDSQKKVSYLSGGEKGRLALAKIVLQGANLLILDEPTNHLDIRSREALEDAITSFGGTVLTVSHDRYFLDSVAEKIFELDGARLTEYWGNYSYYSEKKAAQAVEAVQAESAGRATWEDRKHRQAEDKKREREAKKQADRISGIEDSIGALEVRMLELERQLADPAVCADYAKVMELTNSYNDLKTERDGLYELLEEEMA